MTNEQLASRYRNLLIVLARTQINLEAEASILKTQAKFETRPGRRAGMCCQANTLQKHAVILRQLIHKNREALLHLFRTTHLSEVARQEMYGKSKQTAVDTNQTPVVNSTTYGK